MNCPSGEPCRRDPCDEIGASGEKLPGPWHCNVCGWDQWGEAELERAADSMPEIDPGELERWGL